MRCNLGAKMAPKYNGEIEMKRQASNLVNGLQQPRVGRVLLAIAAVTMFVLSAGAPGATGW